MRKVYSFHYQILSLFHRVCLLAIFYWLCQVDILRQPFSWIDEMRDTNWVEYVNDFNTSGGDSGTVGFDMFLETFMEDTKKGFIDALVEGVKEQPEMAEKMLKNISDDKNHNEENCFLDEVEQILLEVKNNEE